MKRKLIAKLDDGDSLFELNSKDPQVCEGDPNGGGKCKKPAVFVVGYELEGEKQYFSSCFSCEVEYWKDIVLQYPKVIPALKKFLEDHPEIGLEI